MDSQNANNMMPPQTPEKKSWGPIIGLIIIIVIIFLGGIYFWSNRSQSTIDLNSDIPPYTEEETAAESAAIIESAPTTAGPNASEIESALNATVIEEVGSF